MHCMGEGLPTGGFQLFLHSGGGAGFQLSLHYTGEVLGFSCPCTVWGGAEFQLSLHCMGEGLGSSCRVERVTGFNFQYLVCQA